MWALLVVGGGAGFIGLTFVLTSIHHWLVNPERNMALVLVPIGLTSILIGSALLVVTTAVYVLGSQSDPRQRLRLFVRAGSRLGAALFRTIANKFDPAALAQAILRASIRASFNLASTGRFTMTLPQDIAKLQSEMSAAVREHWKAFLIEGILLAVLGLAAMIAPLIASLAFTIFLGWMFLISGAAGLAMTLWARQMPGFWWSLISAVAGRRRRHHSADKARPGRTHPHDRDWRLFPG